MHPPHDTNNTSVNNVTLGCLRNKIKNCRKTISNTFFPVGPKMPQ